jgi:hypothetical protein
MKWRAETNLAPNQSRRSDGGHRETRQRITTRLSVRLGVSATTLFLTPSCHHFASGRVLPELAGSGSGHRL